MRHAELEATGVPPRAALGVDALLLPANRRGSQTAWFDVFPTGEGRFAVLVGCTAPQADVQALTAAARDVLETQVERTEPGVLQRAAQVLFANGAEATVGIVDRKRRTFTYISAGHPAPYLRFHDGAVAALPGCGGPAEAAERASFPAQVVADLSGAAFLLLHSSFSDTSTPADGHPLRRFEGILLDERFAACASPAAFLAQRLVVNRSHDEAAVVAAMFPPGGTRDLGEPPRWSATWTFHCTSAASHGARRAFLACLAWKRERGPEIDRSLAELIFGELLGNVVRHAPGPVEIRLEWTGELPVLHVLDRGPGFRSRRKRERLPLDDFSESGRGLYIVNSCAVEFSVRNRNGRGTHACATLPPAAGQ